MLRWNDEKGFGFIKPDDDGPDLFCHKSGLLDGEGSVRDGDEVRFKIQYDDRKGKDRAEQVEAVGGGGGGRSGGGGRDRRDRSRSDDRSRDRRRDRSYSGGRSGGGGRDRRDRSRSDDRTMPTGRVIRWNSDKGFGFIKPDEDGDDLFAHVSQLLDGEGSVRDGDEVRFKIEYDDRKGKDRATNVELVGGGGGGGGGRSRSPPRRGGGGRDRTAAMIAAEIGAVIAATAADRGSSFTCQDELVKLRPPPCWQVGDKARLANEGRKEDGISLPCERCWCGQYVSETFWGSSGDGESSRAGKMAQQQGGSNRG
ncbi:unnamed protein product [Polarella glacialis]|uniref:CSD domain-containing protein n=1 Tax=Polarella glacialis TaxID=89957 RepID=A0A813K648_POLGL|nr:unnamed protein product [Polarella glacialis]